jgi:hypothetical protein
MRQLAISVAHDFLFVGQLFNHYAELRQAKVYFFGFLEPNARCLRFFLALRAGQIDQV